MIITREDELEDAPRNCVFLALGMPPGSEFGLDMTVWNGVYIDRACGALRASAS